MMKMFMTQLNGLFQRIYDKEEPAIEDGARLLAQAIVGDGKIYIKSFKEMDAVTVEALESAEPLTGAAKLSTLGDLTETDRVLIITRFSNDPEAILLGRKLSQKGIPFTAIAGTVKDAENNISDLADVYINTFLIRGMLPTETGERTAFPASMAALFIYYGIKFALDEMMDEY
jgi:hypothetical protein